MAISMLLAATATAHADAPAMTPPLQAAPIEQDTGSYRLQTALTDVAAVALFAMAATSQDGDAAGSLGVAMYIAGGPIVHLIHHHSVRAAESVALRVGLPLVAGAVGASIASGQCTNPDDDCAFGELGAAVVGAIGGAIAASVIDIAYLSRGESAAPPSQAAVVPPPMPIAPAEPHQVRVGVTFAF